MLKKFALVTVFIIPSLSYGQQESTIKNIQSNNGLIEVTQMGDSTKKSLIDSVRGDSIRIVVTQTDNGEVRTTSKPGRFWDWISNLNNLFSLIVAILSLLTAAGLVKTYGQQIAEKNSKINNIKGNNNIITVIQGTGNIVKYNMLDKNQAAKFLDYLKEFPTINNDIKQLLRYDKKILELLSKIYERTNDDGVLNPIKFFEKLENYIRENERLRVENEELRKQTKDTDFAQVIKVANKRLEEYDNEGYDKALEDYKNGKKKEFAMASYLQAKNSFNIYNYQKAGIQISEAISNDDQNPEYLFLRGLIYYAMAKYDESLSDYLKVINLNVSDSMNAQCLNDIGLIYMEKGEYEKALSYSTKAIEIKTILFGKEHSNTATSYNNIGLIYQQTGDYHKALEYYQMALKIKVNVYGSDSPEVIVSYENIAGLYLEIQEYALASHYYQIAFDLRGKTFGREHPAMESLYNNIGGLYVATKDYDKALEFFQKALSIKVRIFGKEHSSVAISYSNIGSVYNAKKDYNTALEYFQNGLTIQEKAFGKDHINCTTLYNNIGGMYKEKKEYDKALDYYSKALIIQEKVLGQEHFTTAKLYHNIGAVYLAKFDYDKTLDYYLKELDIQQKVFGKESRITIRSYEIIGLIYISKGDVQLGLTYLSKTAFSNLTNYEKAKLMNYHGGLKYDLNKKEALNFYQIALELLEKSDTPETDPAWISIYQNLASAYCHNGKKSKALALYKRCIDLRKRVANADISLEQIETNYKKCKEN